MVNVYSVKIGQSITRFSSSPTRAKSGEVVEVMPEVTGCPLHLPRVKVRFEGVGDAICVGNPDGTIPYLDSNENKASYYPPLKQGFTEDVRRSW